MNSLWLCCDPLPAKDLQKKEPKSTSSPFLGVFTEDPSIIGRILPRPITPFHDEMDQYYVSKYDEEERQPNLCESPPTISIDFDFTEKNIKGGELSIF